MSKTTASKESIREMICISCPIGCHLQLFKDENDSVVVKGNRCPRGKEYGREEYFAPKRIVTATCRTDSEIFPRLAVLTDHALPKDHINNLLSELYQMEVHLPVKRGKVILEDYAGTGVNLIASITLEGGGNEGQVRSQL